MKKLFSVCIALLSICMMLTGCNKNDDYVVRIGSLKGPTTIGLVKLMDDSDNQNTKNNYSFEMAVTADELLPKLISGDLDIALVPANVASVLYNKTNGGIVCLDINTLGVLYAVSGDGTIECVDDLKGKTVYVTNKGTTPDYVTQYILKINDVSPSDVNIEYLSEATEVVATLKEHPDCVGILPQPFVTVACMQNEELKVVLDLTKEWEDTEKDSQGRLVTGVTVARKDFALNNKNIIAQFLKEHKASAEFAVNNAKEASVLVEKFGIIEKAPVAEKAIPKCNITYIDNNDMKDALSSYLKVLYEFDPSSIGGSLPDEDFYYFN